jgi:hypothetical protein
VGGFDGNLIGFINMDDADGLDQEIQSATLGNLSPGKTYTLRVAVGARAGQATWNDVKYDIMLVANPLDGAGGASNKFGSSGGVVLGTPASAILAPATATPNTSNIVDLVYTYTALTSDPFAIRIAAHNAKTQNGVIDPNDPSVGGTGTNYRFTQANFDNVRLTAVPEPAAAVLAAVSVMAVVAYRRRTPCG